LHDVITTKDAYPPIGPYSQGIKANGLVFVSGQVPLDPQTQQMINGDIVAQTRRVLDNVAAILRAAGSDLNKVVRTTVYLRSMTDFAAMNQVYAQYFTSAPPARSTIQAILIGDALVEIDVIARA
jgi:2-iminobutanoate/2-iminopropanoate deaminase